MPLKILAVDDSATIRGMLTMTLTSAGFNVVVAEDGMLGLEQMDEEKPDLVITDINMPRLDGFGFIRGVREERENSSTPILVLTTETGADLKAKARAAGATGWIVKPFHPEKLVSTINRLTDERE